MRIYELITELKLNGLNVFKPGDVSRLTGKNVNYIYLLLSKSKLIEKAQNGIYYLPNTDPLEVASNIVSPSYISLASAFSYYNTINQIPIEIKVISPKRHRTLHGISGLDVRFKNIKKEMIYGYYRKNNICIAYLEKAIIDALYLNEDVRYLKEVVKNSCEAKTFSAERLDSYALQSKSPKIINEAAKLSSYSKFRWNDD